MDIVSRLIRFKDFTGLTNSQFADTAQIPRPTLSQFLNGRNKRLSDDLCAKLHSAFPMLNMLWLLFGEGDMLTDSNIEFSASKIAQNLAENKTEATTLQEFKAENNLFSEIEKKEENRKKSTLNGPSALKDSKEQEILRGFTKEPDNNEVGTSKDIKYVMVFYDDNSYEVFRPK